MSGIPLHPLVVHFPVVLVMLLQSRSWLPSGLSGKVLHRVGYGPYRWR
jgi:hypothetical protein